jgi:hypothetical protein
MAAGEQVFRRKPLFLPLSASVATCSLLSGFYAAVSGGSMSLFVLGLLVGGFIGLLLALLFGVPFVYWLLRRGRFDARRMALGGFVIGALPQGVMAILGGWISSGGASLISLLAALMFITVPGVIGALSAWTYFLVYRRFSSSQTGSGSLQVK